MDDVDDDGSYSGTAADASHHPAAPLPHGNNPDLTANLYDAYLRPFLSPSSTRLEALRLDPTVLHDAYLRPFLLPSFTRLEPPHRTTTATWDRYYNFNDGDLGADDGDAYGGGGFGAVPASGVAVACLRERTVGEFGEEVECAVCLERYATGQALRTMPCEHEFHETCIFGWLRVSRFCPLCRFTLPADF